MSKSSINIIQVSTGLFVLVDYILKKKTGTTSKKETKQNKKQNTTKEKKTFTIEKKNIESQDMFNFQIFPALLNGYFQKSK